MSTDNVMKESPAPSARAGLETITPYQQGRSSLASGAEPIKLSSNESPLGPSPAAIAAYQAEAPMLHRYPDGAQAALREAIGRVHDLDPALLICGNGSEELIGLVTRAFLAPGDQMLLSEHHFVMCPIYCRAQGGEVVLAPERNWHTDVDALLARVSPQTRIVIVANPNNPTGTYLPEAALRRLHAGLPASAVLIIDNAYAEYVTEPDYWRGYELVSAAGNVVVTHTFSKIYGLAGLRIGWALCPPAIRDAVNRIRTPFNTNRAALAAAEAAVQDQAHVARVREHNNTELARISAALARIGIPVVPSVANFYLLDFTGVDGRSAVAAAAALEDRRIIPRGVGVDGADVLRITVGLREDNDAVLAALADYMQQG